MKNRWILVVMAFGVLACSAQASFAQCDGLIYAGAAYGEGSFDSNLVATGEVILPPNIKLDTSYHQTTIGTASNGKSSANSRLVVSEVPAGICIVPSGDNTANHGWAVGDGAEPRVQLIPAAWDMTTNTITQYKLGIRLYCTTGSGEPDRTTGGCNAKVSVYYKPLAVTVAKASAKKPK